MPCQGLTGATGQDIGLVLVRTAADFDIDPFQVQIRGGPKCWPRGSLRSREARRGPAHIMSVGLASLPTKDFVLSVETVLALVASSFGVVMGVAPALQIRRMLRERSSRDVSIGYFAIIACGSVLWGSYGVSLGNFAIVIPNVVGFLAAIATVGVALRLGGQEQLMLVGLSDGEEQAQRQVDWQPAR
jgi:MtN3 and saliva related transmembrane protein